GGRDPEARWNRNWDGRWRLVLFDLPTRPRHLRQRLLRWLHQNHFGYLQRSVWIHPDPLSELAPTLAEYRDDVESLTVLKAQTVAGYTNAALVQGAWDFDEINKRYTIYLDGFGRKRAAAIASGRGTFTWASRWLRAERVAWQHAVALDPLLPRALLPSGYRGTEAGQARRRVVRAVFNAFTRTQ
ncbi:hypothetical protein HQ590_13770, partial [bacterium]|nr:hypothetical protein [bacterium]